MAQKLADRPAKANDIKREQLVAKQDALERLRDAAVKVAEVAMENRDAKLELLHEAKGEVLPWPPRIVT